MEHELVKKGIIAVKGRMRMVQFKVAKITQTNVVNNQIGLCSMFRDFVLFTHCNNYNV